MDSECGELLETKFTCSICDCEFDIDREGGVTGDLGVLPVSFCPTCHSALYDFFAEANDF